MIAIKPKTIVHYFHDENEQSVTLRCPSVADYNDAVARATKNGKQDDIQLTMELLITASNGDLDKEFLSNLSIADFTALSGTLAEVLPKQTADLK